MPLGGIHSVFFTRLTMPNRGQTDEHYLEGSVKEINNEFEQNQ